MCGRAVGVFKGSFPVFGPRSLRWCVVDILESLYVNLWRHFEHINRVLSSSIKHALLLTHPPSIPTHNRWSVEPAAFSPERAFLLQTRQSLSHSTQLFQSHHWWSPTAQGCYGDPGCEFCCPLCTPLVSSRLIWYENSSPLSLCQVPWPGLGFTLSFIMPVSFFPAMSPGAKSSLPFGSGYVRMCFRSNALLFLQFPLCYVANSRSC